MESKFTGTLAGLIGINIVQLLLTFFTLGIGAPWAMCIKQRWLAKHTVIDGRRHRFDGTGGQLFGKYILWFLLLIVTFGIYGFWLNINMHKWMTAHTHHE